MEKYHTGWSGGSFPVICAISLEADTTIKLYQYMIAKYPSKKTVELSVVLLLWDSTVNHNRSVHVVTMVTYPHMKLMRLKIQG